jgi:hypothetical protein
MVTTQRLYEVHTARFIGTVCLQGDYSALRLSYILVLNQAPRLRHLPHLCQTQHFASRRHTTHKQCTPSESSAPALKLLKYVLVLHYKHTDATHATMKYIVSAKVLHPVD